MRASVDVEFEVWQDGMPVAWVSAADRCAAANEAGHYCMVYGQDGPVTIYEVTRRLIATDELDAMAGGDA